MIHVFVDFEMTCWRKRERTLGRKFQEIIEIGAVKMDENLNILDSFSTCVRPELNSLLSRKCIQLTGITERELKDCSDLCEALLNFEEWVGTEDVKFYAWGEDDRRQLLKECIEKRIYSTLPPMYQRWCNFQKVFMRIYKFRQQPGLLYALELAGFDFDGKQHRAVDDALNSAKLVQMMKNPGQHQKFKRIYTEAYRAQPALSLTIGELLREKLLLCG